MRQDSGRPLPRARRSFSRRIAHRLREFVHRMLSAHVTPGRLAIAVLVGAIVGCSPFFGLHLPICIGLAWLLRLNQPTVYVAANVSVLPLAPAIAFGSVQIGERLLHGRFLPLGLAAFRDPEGGLSTVAARFFASWALGGLILGAAIGATMATVVYAVARRRARGAGTADDPVARAIAEATRRYDAAPLTLRLYARFKYRLDPCYRAIARLVPEGAVVVDLGTGLGMLPLVLALLPGGRRGIGVDWDRRKLGAGRAAGLNAVDLVEGDARTFPIPPCDAVTLVDVLHYFEPAVQRDLLARAAAALRPGGLLLVREGDAGRRQGAAWTRTFEALTVRLGWNRAAGGTMFRDAGDLRREMESLDLCVTIEPVAGKLYPGNVLLRGEKRAPYTFRERRGRSA